MLLHTVVVVVVVVVVAVVVVAACFFTFIFKASLSETNPNQSLPHTP